MNPILPSPSHDGGSCCSSSSSFIASLDNLDLDNIDQDNFLFDDDLMMLDGEGIFDAEAPLEASPDTEETPDLASDCLMTQEAEDTTATGEEEEFSTKPKRQSRRRLNAYNLVYRAPTTLLASLSGSHGHTVTSSQSGHGLAERPRDVWNSPHTATPPEGGGGNDWGRLPPFGSLAYESMTEEEAKFLEPAVEEFLEPRDKDDEEDEDEEDAGHENDAQFDSSAVDLDALTEEFMSGAVGKALAEILARDSSSNNNNKDVIPTVEASPWTDLKPISPATSVLSTVRPTIVCDTEVCSEDVLLGRGRKLHQHPGNAKLRELVTHQLDAYEASHKREQTKMADRIVRTIADHGGRFLKPLGATKAPAGRSTPRTPPLWTEIEKIEARQKVAYTFRGFRKKQRVQARKVLAR